MNTAVIILIIAKIACIGIFLSSIEDILGYSTLKTSGLLSWTVGRLFRGKKGLKIAYPITDIVYSEKVFLFILTLRGVAALSILIWPISSSMTGCISGLYLLMLCLTIIVLRRSLFGLDGSQQMNFLIFFAITASSLINSPFSKTVTLYFIAIQLIFSYFISGIYKLFSPVWRNGDALSGVFNNTIYGNKIIREALIRYPSINVGLSWGVFLFETFFFIIIFMPIKFVFLFLFLGFILHFSIMISMGLTNFLFAFLAAYPAVIFFIFEIKPILQKISTVLVQK